MAAPRPSPIVGFWDFTPGYVVRPEASTTRRCVLRQPDGYGLVRSSAGWGAAATWQELVRALDAHRSLVALER
jgi:hypothetical protein